jgi:hypothetical protein
MTAIVREAATFVGERAACEALGVPRSSYRRWSSPRFTHPTKRRTGGRALSRTERQRVLDILHEERFIDLPVPQVHAALLEEDTYHCSVRTMYRILDSVGENVERRNVRTYTNVSKPELLATRPNELWRCGGWGTDYDGRRCVLVEHTPWACELEPPAEGIQACGGESPPWGYWQPGHEDVVRRSSLPCHLRPVGYETCWDNPIPACWCHCYPPPCETWPFCPPDDGGTGGSTGADVDTTNDLGATDDTTGPATSTTTSN